MTGYISLDKEKNYIRIVFPYDPYLVELVRRIPGRIWDKNEKVWLVPKEQVIEVLRVFLPKGFTASSEVEELLDSCEGNPKGTTPEKAYTISELNEKVRTALLNAFSSPVWVIGEIHKIQVTTYGHCFLEMVEKREEKEGIKASVQAVVFLEDLEYIERKLNEHGNLKLEVGLEVKVLVQPDIFPERGRYQIVWKDIDPVFTLGKLAKRREEIILKLAKEGLIEKNKSLPWPSLPIRIALITSWESNAFFDFIGVLKNSGFSFSVHCFDTRVQGKELENDLIRALDWFGSEYSKYDILTIIRGGGSRSDLSWFDNFEIAKRVATHPLKVIVGIGHTKDITVLDLIAHSTRSPTEAAEKIVERVRDWIQETTELCLLCPEKALEYLKEEEYSLILKGQRLANIVQARVREEKNILTNFTRTAGILSKRIIDEAILKLKDEESLIFNRAMEVIEKEKKFLDYASSLIKSHHPKRILEKGFALIRNSKGQIVKSIKQVKENEKLDVEISDGGFIAEVLKRYEEEE